MKKAILALGVLASALTANAQTRVCATDDVHREQKARFPGIAEQEARLKEAVDRAMRGRVNSRFAKTTANEDTLTWDQDTKQLHVPVVVHVIYDYAASEATAANAISDAQIESSIALLNRYYNRQALNLGGIIPPFVQYIGNPRISFHLAAKDPNGKPSRGIVRTYSYHAAGGDEAAKINPWDPSKYLNIFLEYKIGRGANVGIILAYATFPTSYSDNPYSQGVISRVDQASSTVSSTLAHEVGHYLFLYHPWSSNGKDVEAGPCGDDEVDDTPPTYGHFSCGPTKLYDTLCATGYYRDYDRESFKKITGVDLPDTIASTVDTNKRTARIYNDSLNNVLGQTFRTGSRSVVMSDISVFVDTTRPVKGGNVRMSLFDATGVNLVARSQNVQNAFASAKLSFNFIGVQLAANTTYKFVIDTFGGHREFRLRTNEDGTKHPFGSLFVDSNARTAVPGVDLQFEVKQLRRIDYPDTTNTQNVMDYSDCGSQMFSRGQVARMRAALRSDVGFRSNLISDKNLTETGIWDPVNDVAIPLPDIAPTALFSQNRYFVCADGASQVTFTNRSYNDTVTDAAWTFSNGAPGTSTSTSTVGVSYTTPGWSNVSLTATGNNTGSSTVSATNAVYAADPNAVNGSGYFQEFNPGNDLDMYPMFNYFNMPDHKWETFNGAGLFDQTCVRFRNFDTRSAATIGNATAAPGGSYGDMFTRAFNLSDFSGNICNLSFFTAGAFRTNRPSQMNDTLEIAASNSCGTTWTTIAKIGKGDLGNNGMVEVPFMPGYSGNWREQAINIPSLFRSDKIFFRFRFRPGTDVPSYTGAAKGTGNHFYLDRLSISNAPLGVKGGVIVSLNMNVAPNPTSGAAVVSLNGGDNSTADISVTDVTGKLVFSSSVVRTASTTKVEIPAAAIAVKGMYLVKVVTNGATETQKLVVY